MLNIAILLADITKLEMSNILTLTWPVTSLVTPRSIKFVFPRHFFQGFQMPLEFFRIGPVVSEIRGGLEIAPPPSGARYKNTPVGRGLSIKMYSFSNCRGLTTVQGDAHLPSGSPRRALGNRVTSVSQHQSPPWPSGLKRWNQTLVPVVRARFEPRCGRPHFAPTCIGVCVCGRNHTEAREREWAEGTVSSLPGTLNVRIKFCHSTGIARSGGGVRASTTSYA